MAFEPPTLVRVTNEGDKPFSDAFDSVKYTILPGKSILCPWFAASLWLGDPTLADDPDKALFSRTAEGERLLVRWGAHVESDRPETQGTDPERIERARPLLVVQDVDGERITMLAEDPTGETALPARFVRGEKDDLFAELDNLKREQARLLELIEDQKNSKNSPGLDQVPDDLPNRVVAPSL